MISTSIAFLSRPAPAAASAIFWASIDGPGIRAAVRGGVAARTGFLKIFVVAFFVTEIKPRGHREHYSYPALIAGKPGSQFTSPRAGIQGKLGADRGRARPVLGVVYGGLGGIAAGIAAFRGPRGNNRRFVLGRRCPRWQTPPRTGGSCKKQPQPQDQPELHSATPGPGPASAPSPASLSAPASLSGSSSSSSSSPVSGSPSTP